MWVIERERGVTERDKQTDDTHRAEAEGRGQRQRAEGSDRARGDTKQSQTKNK